MKLDLSFSSTRLVGGSVVSDLFFDSVVKEWRCLVHGWKDLFSGEKAGLLDCIPECVLPLLANDDVVDEVSVSLC